MTVYCEHQGCEHKADVRVDFGPDAATDPIPMCRHHAGFECRHHLEAETLPLGGDGA